MEMAWCSKCHTDVSLAHASGRASVSGLRRKSFFLVADDSQRETLLFEGRENDASGPLGLMPLML